MRHRWYLLLTVPLILLTSCVPEPLDLALKGKLSEDESNTVVTDYCQTCHIHRTFEPVDHAPRMQALYDGEPYNAALQCRTCHLVSENTWGMKSRKTIFPADVADRRATAPRQNLSRPGILRKISRWLRPVSEEGADAQTGSQGGEE